MTRRFKNKPPPMIVEDGTINKTYEDWDEKRKAYRASRPKRGPKIKGPKTNCPYCPNVFPSRAARARHIQLAHRNREAVLSLVTDGESDNV